MAYKVDFDALDAMYYMMQGHIMTWNEGINKVAEEVSHLISGDQITGKAAENIKSYLQTVHLAIMNSLAQLFQSHIQNCLVYKSAYQAEIDADLHALIQSDELTEIRRNLSAQNSNMQEVDDTIRSALTSVSDIFYTYFVSADPMEETYRTIDMNLKNLNEDITNLENTHLNSDFTETQTLIEELKSFIHDQMAKEKNYISSYTPQILANSPAYAKLFDANMMLTEKQAEKADALQLAYERETARIEQLTEEAAQKREEEGWWKMLLGAGVAVVGVIAIVGTAGMATPVVVTAYVAGGSAIAYGASNMVEAGQDIVYGAMGDPYTVAWNPIRDTIFCGNQTAYDIWGGISTTVAGLVVPIGQSYTFARTAGQSGKVLVQTVGKTVAKEFAEDFVIDKVSMGTGGLVQDFTGNANLSRLASLTAGVATGTQSGKAFQVMDNAAAGVKTLNHIDDVARKVDSPVIKPGVGGSGSGTTKISAEMKIKILEGQRKSLSKNDIIGGHSSQINNTNDLFAVEVISVNLDGTKNIKFIKDLQDGNISKIKKSTIFPDLWNDSKIIDSIKEVGDSPIISVRLRDGATWHRKIIDGVEIDVIKLGDDVISGYPTGKVNAPNPSGF